MGLARSLERRLERLVDGIAARIFRGRIHPVELAGLLIREADLSLRDGPAGPEAPNHFTVVLSGDPVETAAREAIESELEAVVEATAVERGWRLSGPARVEILVAPGQRSPASVEASFDPGEREAWALLRPSDRSADVLVGYTRAIVGRSGDSDVHLKALEVSRRHALLWREAGGIWIYDLGSSNGTYVNGDRIADTTPVSDGDVLSFGDAAFVFRML
jgi:hypothetical protein